MNDELKLLYSQDAEESVLGAALINPDCVRYLDIEAKEFYIQKHQMIWSAITAMDGNANIDIVTLTEELNKRGQLGAVGGAAALAGFINFVPSSIGAESYVKIIKDYSQRRTMLRVASELAKAAYDSKTLDAATASAIDTLALGTSSDNASLHIRDIIGELYTEVEERSKNPKDIWGLETGFTDFDRATGGLQLGEVYYLAGEPGIGKSKLAIQMGINMGRSGIPGAIFSLEMGRKQLVRRSLSALAEVPTRNIKTGRMDADEWTRFNKASEAAQRYPIYINDNSSLTTTQLRAELSRLQARHHIQWGVVDYLLLMGDTEGRNEIEQSAHLSRRIKSIAKSLNVALITVNSVTKDGMGEEAQATQKQIRGSGQVIHDADIIGILKQHVPGKWETKQDNLRTHVFVKGRELEGLGFFHLVAFDKWPSFGNYIAERKVFK